MRTIIFIALILSGMLSLTAQEDKSYILENTNVETLQRLAKKWSNEFQIKHEYALRVAKEKGWPLEGLQYIAENGSPIYHALDNNTAAIMTNTTVLRNNFSVQGQGMQIGIWDGGSVRASHQDMAGRVLLMNPGAAVNSHATHVAGTLIGSPPNGVASRGMAPQAVLRSYDSGNHFAEMAQEASTGLLVSNHSYSPDAGWEKDATIWCNFLQLERWETWTWWGGTGQFNATGDDPLFGQYSNDAMRMDTICSNAPMYLPVFSSSNENSENPHDDFDCKDEVRDGPNGTYVDYDPSIHPAGDGTKRSNIKSYSNSKNILTVGNLQDDLTLNPSSSRGMTDDGRIKPDICGKGTNIFSAESAADNAYGTKTGTSMSSPNVAGSLLLLQELYNDYHGSGIFMRSATLKGLAIHTATDLGSPGPDVNYGWGLLNANLAGQVIASDAALLSDRIIEVANPSGMAYSFYSNGQTPIRVTMCYTDVAGTATSVHNDPTIKLVNDLDLTLVRQGSGATYYPYVLDVNNPTTYATNGDNDRDNVEQVYILFPSPGFYEVHVNVEGSLTGTQPFSLIISGREPCTGLPDITQGTGVIPSDDYDGANITSAATIANGNWAVFNATNQINLVPGFQAQSGSSFLGRIYGCQ